jgi:hypothetical protein
MKRALPRGTSGCERTITPSMKPIASAVVLQARPRWSALPRGTSVRSHHHARRWPQLLIQVAPLVR